MIYVGIDPAIGNTGYVMLSSDLGIIRADNTKDWKLRNKTRSSEYERQLYNTEVAEVLAYDVRGEADSQGSVVVAYENYSYGSNGLLLDMAEFGGILKSSLVRVVEDIEGLHLVAPNSLKSFATLRGVAAKDMMLECAKKEASDPALITTHDVADAYFLAKFAAYLHDAESAAANDTNKDAVRWRVRQAQRLHGLHKMKKTN